MPGFTIHFTVDTEARNAWEATNDVENALRTFEDIAERAGVVFNTQGITDEDGEWVDLENYKKAYR